MDNSKKIEAAKECFGADVKGQYEELHVCSDLQCFGSDHDAHEHQKGLDKKIKPFTVKREDISLEKEYAENAKNTIISIKAATTVEAVDAIVGDDDRSTVLAAAEAQIKSLEAAAGAGAGSNTGAGTEAGAGAEDSKTKKGDD